MKISVCIPTYQRPILLRGAIQSLEEQTRPPDEVIVVWRDGDVQTQEVLHNIVQQSRLKLTVLPISEPGFLPPIRVAIDKADSDVLAFMDDDAAAFPDWLFRMEQHYLQAPGLGGVGGRIVTVFDGVVANYPPAKVVGRLDYIGRSFGNMYRDVSGGGVRSVAFLAGGNMSYLTPVLKEIGIDDNLGKNVASNWELDVGLSVMRLGYKIAYDPDMKVFHYTGPRPQLGMRGANADGVYWHNFNYSYIMAKHLPYHRLALHIVYRVVVGTTDLPGLFNIIGNILLRRRFEWIKLAPIAMAGSIAGLISSFRRPAASDRLHKRKSAAPPIDRSYR